MSQKHKPIARNPNSIVMMPTLVSVSKYAAKRGVSRTAIYLAIGENRIIPTLIGEDQDVYIDIAIYPPIPWVRKKRDDQ